MPHALRGDHERQLPQAVRQHDGSKNRSPCSGKLSSDEIPQTLKIQSFNVLPFNLCLSQAFKIWLFDTETSHGLLYTSRKSQPPESVLGPVVLYKR